MMIDPIHMNCATCIWWRRQGPQLANAERDPSCARDTGICQRHAPVVVDVGPRFPASLFPQTHETRFCGDWQGASYGGDGDGGERIVVPFPAAANRVAA